MRSAARSNRTDVDSRAAGLDGVRTPVSPVRMRIASSIARYEDLAIADATGLLRPCWIASTAFSTMSSVIHDDLDLHLREKVHHIFRTSVEFGMALLPAKPFCFRDGDAFDADLVKRFLHLVELERLDDRFEFFHGAKGILFPGAATAGQTPPRQGDRA